MRFLPQMKIRWTQMKCKAEELTQRRKGAEKKMPCLLCAFAPLREILLWIYLCPSDFHPWQ
jgi:hypothetical protein